MTFSVEPIGLDISLSVSDTPPSLVEFSLLAGLPGRAVDLAPLLAAIEAIPAVDLGPVLAALTSMGSVDVPGSLAFYEVATDAHVQAARAAILAAISALPTTDVAAALTAYAGATKTDLTAAKTTVLALINARADADAADLATSHADLRARIDAIPITDVAAALATYDGATQADLNAAVAPLATATALTSATAPLATSAGLAAALATLLAAGFTSTAATAVLTAYGSATLSQLTAAQNSLAVFIGTRAGAADLSTARSDLLAAIAAIPTTDIAAALATYDGATQADLNVVLGLLAADIATGTAATATNLTAAVAPLATTAQLADAQAAIIAAIPGGSGTASTADVTDAQAAIIAAVGPQSGDMRLMNNTTGIAPAGWTKASGLEVPAFSNRTAAIAAAFSTGIPGLSQGAMSSDVFYVAFPTGAFWSYTVSTDTWATRAALTINVNNRPGPLVAYNSKLYMLGSTKNGPSGVFDMVVRIYNIATNTWSNGATIPGTARHGLFAWANSATGQAYVCGGSTHDAYFASPSAATLSDSICKYDIGANTWSTLGNVLPTRAYMTTSSGFCMPLAGKYAAFASQVGNGTTHVWAGPYPFTVAIDGSSATFLDAATAYNAAATIFEISIGVLAYLPVVVPGSGSRWKQLNTAASTGLQWSDWTPGQSLPALLSNTPSFADAALTTGGRQLFSLSTSCQLLIAAAAPPVSFDQSFWARKN